MDNIQLIEWLNKGDTKALDTLYKLYFSALCQFADNYLENGSILGEDIVQEVFIKAWELREKFTSITGLKSFLYISVRNKAFSQVKKIKIRNRYAKEQLNINQKSEFVDFVIKQEVIRILHQTLNSLPERSRQICKMSFIDGMKRKDIANNLNISENTVKKLKALSINKIRNSTKNWLYSIVFFL